MLFKKAKGEAIGKSKAHAIHTMWARMTWKHWHDHPRTWFALGDGYVSRWEHTLAVDAYQEGLRKMNVKWGCEPPPNDRWDWQSWSYMPYAGCWFKLARSRRICGDHPGSMSAAEQVQLLQP